MIFNNLQKSKILNKKIKINKYKLNNKYKY